MYRRRSFRGLLGTRTHVGVVLLDVQDDIEPHPVREPERRDSGSVEETPEGLEVFRWRDASSTGCSSISAGSLYAIALLLQINCGYFVPRLEALKRASGAGARRDRRRRVEARVRREWHDHDACRAMGHVF